MRLFATERRAYIAVIVLTLVFALIYVSLIGFGWFRGGCYEVEQCERPWSDAVSADPVLYLDVVYDDEVLLRFFAPGRIAEFKESLNADLADWREVAFEKRKAAIDTVERLTRYFKDDLGQPPPLDRRSVGLMENDYRYADLDSILSWMEKVEDRVDQDLKTPFEVGRQLIEASKIQEDKIIRLAEARGEQLDDRLSFLWLYTSDGKWVFQLAFWSWFGVFAHTLVALSTATRVRILNEKGIDAGETTAGMPDVYDPELFLLLFPRLVLAPLIAIVVLALAVTELTDIEITVSNLPVFLVFAFLTGFASERFTGVIRAAVNYIIPRLTMSAEREKAQYGQKARELVFALNRNRPRNVREFETVLKDDIKTEMGLALERKTLAPPPGGRDEEK